MIKILSQLIIIFFFSNWTAWSACASDRVVLLGMSADFTGPNRGLGVEYYRGAACFFDQLNDQGGVHEHKVIIKAYDDAYDPDKALLNTIRLVEEDNVLSLFNYVGTPTTTRILPLLKYYQDQHVFLFTPLTGARPVLENPFIISLRASYDSEISVLIDKLVKEDVHRVAVLHQLDAYGRGGWQSVRNALEGHGFTIVAEATYKRGAGMNSDFLPQVTILKAQHPEAIISIAAYEPAAAFIRDARNNGLDVPIFNLSFVSADEKRDILTKLEGIHSKSYLHQLVNSNVVPFYGYEDFQPVREYAACLELRSISPPVTAHNEEYQLPGPNAVGFEGYLNAWFIADILNRTGPELERQNIARELSDYLEAGQSLHFSKVFPQWEFQDKIFFIAFEEHSPVPLEDFSGLFQ
ncbi:ABC transporter substrate-binding protein [Desulfonatronovibrio magnus]|uniref:ABC transporter substrate-binding protein n=1 Tax=Desulfonatronovibrio magnus TaxID=698827 RepID=UPI000A07B105|nr:ABC transporter substrate-binding protein [Desulfonatronovibrio magnus]RQD60677.1 MAG: ABC transporter substrate-binding protein [Desulfonatronovibrio sp. MSAO_Bac4]